MRPRRLFVLPALVLGATQLSFPVAEPAALAAATSAASRALAHFGDLAAPAPRIAALPLAELPAPTLPPPPPEPAAADPTSPPALDPAAVAPGSLPLPAPTSAAAEPAAIDPASLPEVPPELVDDGSDALPPEEPPPAEPEPEVHELASIARESWIFAEPRWGSRRLGYLRAGAIVPRRARPAGKAGCPGGWYHVEPRGYVCVGATATLDIHAPVVEASRRRPTLGEGLPYTYVLARSSTPPPLYARLPSPEEQRRAEPDLAHHLRQAAALARSADFVPPPEPEPTPNALLYDRPAPPLGGERRDPAALVIGRAQPRSGFALLSTFEHEGRPFGFSTDLAVIPLDRTRVVRESAFAGLRLEGELTLPVAFVRRKHAARLVPGEGGVLARGPALGFREAVAITGAIRRVGGVEHRVALDGSLIRAEDVVVVDAPRRLPAWAKGGRKWIDVSILRQSLTAWEGDRPVYVTLVSTGADGLGDPKETHSTIQGAFLIHTKHVTATMDGDEADDDRFDFRDVPFVQYFTEGYALHAAYWHDDFGTPRSHGCVNLAPRDAAWLFGWTTPEVPAGWHAALSLKKGTLVHIHP